KAVRAKMVEKKLCRKTINARVQILQRAWRWCLSEDLVPSDSYESVAAVTSLRLGAAGCEERPAVKPANPEHVQATVKAMQRFSPFLADAVQVQMLSGLRPGEAMRLRHDEMDCTAQDVWVWRPQKHKTAHRGKRKAHVIGPRAVAILSQYLRL